MDIGRKNMIKNISIHGLRGFGEERTISFAIPQEGVKGSGLTILVGSNNAGKTTILEAIRSFNCSQNEPPSFAERKRNIKCENGKVHLLLKTTDIGDYRIDTIDSGGSTTTICTVDFDIPNFFAALRTVAPLSTMYSPSSMARASVLVFTAALPFAITWLVHVYAEK